MNYDDRKRLNGLQELRPLSIPHREEPEEEIVEEEEYSRSRRASPRSFISTHNRILS